MKTSEECISIIRNHEQELRERFGITSIRLFGSVARGDQYEGSDVDLICDHANLRPFFRQQIEQDGINIFTAA